MSVSNGLQEQYEDFFYRLLYFPSILASVVLESLDTFQRLSVRVDELENDIERQQKLHLVETCIARTGCRIGGVE